MLEDRGPGDVRERAVRGSSSHTSLACPPESQVRGVGELDCDERPVGFGEHAVAKVQGARPSQARAGTGREVHERQVGGDASPSPGMPGAALISAALALMTSNWPCTANRSRTRPERGSTSITSLPREITTPAGVSPPRLPHGTATAGREPGSSRSVQRRDRGQVSTELADADRAPACSCAGRARASARRAPHQAVGADQELGLGDRAARTVLACDDGERPAGRRGQRDSAGSRCAVVVTPPSRARPVPRPLSTSTIDAGPAFSETTRRRCVGRLSGGPVSQSGGGDRRSGGACRPPPPRPNAAIPRHARQQRGDARDEIRSRRWRRRASSITPASRPRLPAPQVTRWEGSQPSSDRAIVTGTMYSVRSTATTPRSFTSRSPHRSARRSPTAKPSRRPAPASAPPRGGHRCQHQHRPGALRLPRDEGLLELRQGDGVRVVGTPNAAPRSPKPPSSYSSGNRTATPAPSWRE